MAVASSTPHRSAAHESRRKPPAPSESERLREESRLFDRRLVRNLLLLGLSMWAVAGILRTWSAVTHPEGYGPGVCGAVLAIFGSAPLLMGLALAVGLSFSKERRR